MAMIWNEEDIILGCIKKKRAAQKALFDKYHRMMSGLCLRYCNTKDEADDILLEGFFHIYTRIGSYAGTGSFVSWMKRVFINTAIDHYRKNVRHYHHAGVEEAQNILFSENTIPQAIAANEMMEMINALPAGYKLVFNLYAIEGYSHKEIAEMLGISENTSKTQLLKARKRLQRELAATGIEIKPVTQYE